MDFNFFPCHLRWRTDNIWLTCQRDHLLLCFVDFTSRNVNIFTYYTCVNMYSFLLMQETVRVHHGCSSWKFCETQYFSWGWRRGIPTKWNPTGSLNRQMMQWLSMLWGTARELILIHLTDSSCSTLHVRGIWHVSVAGLPHYWWIWEPLTAVLELVCGCQGMPHI